MVEEMERLIALFITHSIRVSNDHNVPNKDMQILCLETPLKCRWAPQFAQGIPLSTGEILAMQSTSCPPGLLALKPLRIRRRQGTGPSPVTAHAHGVQGEECRHTLQLLRCLLCQSVAPHTERSGRGTSEPWALPEPEQGHGHLSWQKEAITQTNSTGPASLPGSATH